MSTGWSADGPELIVPATTGWSAGGPVDPEPDPVQGWTAEQWAQAAVSGDAMLIGQAYANAYVTAKVAGAGTLAANAFAKVYISAQLSGDGHLAAQAYAKLYSAATTDSAGVLTASGVIASRGPLTYTGAQTNLAAPWWARYVDVILLGGGKAGSNGGVFLTGTGGKAGSWNATTIDLGVNHAAFQISTTVGAGGTVPSGNGAASTATWSGAASGSLSAAGATAENSSTVTGASPGNFTYNNTPYTGGAAQTTSGAAGNNPGGGGAGGPQNKTAGAGAKGTAIIVFRQT